MNYDLQTPAGHLICHEYRSGKTIPSENSSDHQDGFPSFVDLVWPWHPGSCILLFVCWNVMFPQEELVSATEQACWNHKDSTSRIWGYVLLPQPWEIHIVSLMPRHKCCVLWPKDLPNTWSQLIPQLFHPTDLKFTAENTAETQKQKTPTVKCKVSSAYQQPLNKFQALPCVSACNLQNHCKYLGTWYFPTSKQPTLPFHLWDPEPSQHIWPSPRLQSQGEVDPRSESPGKDTPPKTTFFVPGLPGASYGSFCKGIAQKHSNSQWNYQRELFYMNPCVCCMVVSFNKQQSHGFPRNNPRWVWSSYLYWICRVWPVRIWR